jgi:methyl-accepting chemotaxis protein
MPDLARVVEELRDMNRITEADFLAVGEKLMGFLSAARNIRSDISQLANYISGDSGQCACSALASVLHRSVEMKQCAEEASRTLGSLSHTADNIQRCFSGFHQIVLSFQVAATLARMETARLGGSQSGLGHLADEVRSCTEDIRTRVEHALQAVVGLEQYIDRAIQRLSEQDSQQLEALPSLVGAVQEALAAFRLRQQQANETSARLAREFAAFSEAIHCLVEALQFHDITRQQVEHVIESLDLILTDAHGRRPTTGPSPADVAIISLQRQQLLGAAQTFASSVQRVKQELAEAAARGHEMEAETKTLLGLVAEDPQSSFFADMERCFAGVLGAVESRTAVQDETSKNTAELLRATEGLERCVEDVRTIWLQVNRLALNATLEASHLGQGGEPLSVIAGSMQSLYASAEQRSNETRDSLAMLRASLISTIPSSMPFPTTPAPSDGDAMLGELERTVNELGASSERSLACSKQISAVAATLCADVLSASDSFTVGKLVEETLDRSCGLLQRITAESNMDPTRTTSGLEHLAAQYTMLAEREVHARATGKGVSAPSNEEPLCQPAPALPEDLGGGVELF